MLGDPLDLVSEMLAANDIATDISRLPDPVMVMIGRYLVAEVWRNVHTTEWFAARFSAGAHLDTERGCLPHVMACVAQWVRDEREWLDTLDMDAPAYDMDELDD